MSRDPHVLRTMHGLEPLEACIQSRDAAAGESHHGDTGSVDARIGGQDVDRTISVEDLRELPDPALITEDLIEAAPGIAVDPQGRHAQAVEHVGPPGDPRIVGTAGAMKEHDGRKWPGTRRPLEAAGQGHGRTGGLIALQELIVRQGPGWNLDPFLGRQLRLGPDGNRPGRHEDQQKGKPPRATPHVTNLQERAGGR